jgi:uncharacterized delta-60 repeat protein
MWSYFSPRSRASDCLRRSFSRPQVEVLEDRCLLSPGQLDTTFGSGGLVNAPSGGGAHAIVLQSDGKLVVMGDSLVRYNTNGTLDSTFGNGGIVNFSSISSKLAGGAAVAIQPNGQIVTANTFIYRAATRGHYLSTDYAFAVARWNADGSIDTTFGGNYKIKGVEVTNLDAPPSGSGDTEQSNGIALRAMAKSSSPARFPNPTARTTSCSAITPTARWTRLSTPPVT